MRKSSRSCSQTVSKRSYRPSGGSGDGPSAIRVQRDVHTACGRNFALRRSSCMAVVESCCSSACVIARVAEDDATSGSRTGIWKGVQYRVKVATLDEETCSDEVRGGEAVVL